MTRAGVVSIAAGLGFLLWAAREIGWRRACGLTDEPAHPEAPRLALGGPFGVVRHPVALGASLALIGVALICRSLGAALFAAAAVASIAFAARRSEAALVEHYGEAYRRYRSAVPFLLPLPRRRVLDGRGGGS